MRGILPPRRPVQGGELRGGSASLNARGPPPE
jgi:hypothetical protein